MGPTVASCGILANAGIDYLTATSSSTSTQIFLRGVGHDELGRARRGGNDVKPWAANGYRGYRGGGVSLGDGDAGTILRISGARSADLGAEICGSDANVSRIDLQATV